MRKLVGATFKLILLAAVAAGVGATARALVGRVSEEPGARTSGSYDSWPEVPQRQPDTGGST